MHVWKCVCVCRVVDVGGEELRINPFVYLVRQMYVMYNPNAERKSCGSYQGSVGAIKMLVDPDEHTQTNTFTQKGTPSSDIVFQCAQLERAMSHKMQVTSQKSSYQCQVKSSGTVTLDNCWTIP